MPEDSNKYSVVNEDTGEVRYFWTWMEAIEYMRSNPTANMTPRPPAMNADDSLTDFEGQTQEQARGQAKGPSSEQVSFSIATGRDPIDTYMQRMGYEDYQIGGITKTKEAEGAYRYEVILRKPANNILEAGLNAIGFGLQMGNIRPSSRMAHQLLPNTTNDVPNVRAEGLNALGETLPGYEVVGGSPTDQLQRFTLFVDTIGNKAYDEDAWTENFNRAAEEAFESQQEAQAQVSESFDRAYDDLTEQERAKVLYQQEEERRYNAYLAQMAQFNIRRREAQKYWEKARRYGDSQHASKVLGGTVDPINGNFTPGLAPALDWWERNKGIVTADEDPTLGRDGWRFRGAMEEILEFEMGPGSMYMEVDVTRPIPFPDDQRYRGPEPFNIGPPPDVGSAPSYSAGPGPVYRPPDRREVKDMVKGLAASLIGFPEESSIEAWTDLYMSEHRKRWDDDSYSNDPRQSVLEKIRATRSYQNIHSLRPDTMDEEEWLPRYISYGLAGGMAANNATEYGIMQAQVAGSQDGAQQARNASIYGATRFGGRKTGGIFDGIRNNITTMMRGIR